MKQLNLELKPGAFKDATVTVDGQKLKFKKSGGKYTSVYQTENDTAVLEITRYHETQGALWLLYALLFFVFSLFGIFDVGYGRKCITLKYKLTLKLNEISGVGISFNAPVAGRRAVECTCDCVAEEEGNEYFVDETAKKRMKTLRIIKALTWVALVIGGIVAIVLVALHLIGII